MEVSRLFYFIQQSDSKRKKQEARRNCKAVCLITGMKTSERCCYENAEGGIGKDAEGECRESC